MRKQFPRCASRARRKFKPGKLLTCAFPLAASLPRCCAPLEPRHFCEARRSRPRSSALRKKLSPAKWLPLTIYVLPRVTVASWPKIFSLNFWRISPPSSMPSEPTATTPPQTSIDLVVRGKRVVTPDGEGPAAIHVRGGVIVAISAFDEVPSGATIHEAGDFAVMPGLVDTHVHINEPGRTEWEGFTSATSGRSGGRRYHHDRDASEQHPLEQHCRSLFARKWLPPRENSALTSASGVALFRAMPISSHPCGTRECLVSNVFSCPAARTNFRRFAVSDLRASIASYWPRCALRCLRTRNCLAPLSAQSRKRPHCLRVNMPHG